MNIHEHQAKQILKKYGAVVPEGVFALNVDELIQKAKALKTEKYVLKAQIHAGGRGKAGGVKILNSIEELTVAAKELLGKTLVTHQTGPEGREVKRLYVEESSNIDKEFYLSCLVDRASSKIAFISSDQGGMDIEEVASSSPEKIITTKVDIGDEISESDCEKIINIFNLNEDAKKQAITLIKSIYKMFVSTDANMFASVLTNILYIDLINVIACFFASSFKLKILIIFSQSDSEISSPISTFVVIIFSGELLATSSMSIPPWSLDINAILELALSTRHDK